MATWYKQGVFGSLEFSAANGLRKVERLYESKGKDLFITSVRDGTHTAGSLHACGCAWDQRINGVSVLDIRNVLGNGFDLLNEKDHLHIEFDPK